jgi:hypothetical protein
MAKTKTATSSSTKSHNVKTGKATQMIPPMSPAERAAAVDKNIGKSQSLRDFLIAAGWR